MTGLARSTYYVNKHHRPTDREIRHLLLTDFFQTSIIRSRATYGKRRTQAALAIEQGLIVNRKLITKIMHDLKISDLLGQKKGRHSLVNVATYEDRVQRNFASDTANALWLTDITEHPTPWRGRSTAAVSLISSRERLWVGRSIDVARQYSSTTLSRWPRGHG